MALEDLKFDSGNFWEVIKNFPRILEYINAMHKGKVIMPAGADIGSAKILFSKENWVLDLTNVRFGGSSPDFPLKLKDATASGIAKVTWVDGYVAGFELAPSALSLPFTVATYYILAAVTVAYDSSVGIWSASAISVSYATSITANTSTTIYINLGTVDVIVVGTGYGTANITPAVSGSQWVVRTGSDTTYSDTNGVI
jgi:hypothetical protein